MFEEINSLCAGAGYGAARPAQMVTGSSIPGYAETMGLSKAQESTSYKATCFGHRRLW